METTIEVLVKDKEGNVVFKGSSFSVEGAIDELYRFERHVLPKLGLEDVTDEVEEEETI